MGRLSETRRKVLSWPRLTAKVVWPLFYTETQQRLGQQLQAVVSLI
jgi:hypothetical protein